ncbi:MAG TPA: hypothetical protein VJH55_01320 [Candidatus Paceibacterota bacterium]
MATVINNPGPGDSTTRESASGVGAIIGVIVVLIVLALLVIYGIPALRNGEVQGTGTELNIPNSIDVNIKPEGTTGN